MDVARLYIAQVLYVCSFYVISSFFGVARVFPEYLVSIADRSSLQAALTREGSRIR